VSCCLARPGAAWRTGPASRAAAAGVSRLPRRGSQPATAATTTFTAVTTITGHPDGGAQGNNWANDSFTRTATIHRVNQVTVAECPGSGTGKCWFYTGTLSDSGTFATIAGQLAPRTGSLDQSLAGAFSGGTKTIDFWSSWENPNKADVPQTVSGAATGRGTTTNWVEQFFGPGAVFNSAANPGGPNLGNWSWKYTLNFGSNTACPNDAYQWIDSSTDGGGANPGAGNILTPNSSHCT
jgi:hypothetical protein